MEFRLISILDEKKIPKAIMIWMDSMTSSARRVSLSLSSVFRNWLYKNGNKKLITGVSSEYSIEDFQDADLLVNITKHQLVPQHEIMTKVEKAELLKK